MQDAFVGEINALQIVLRASAPKAIAPADNHAGLSLPGGGKARLLISLYVLGGDAEPPLKLNDRSSQYGRCTEKTSIWLPGETLQPIVLETVHMTLMRLH